MRAWTFDRRGPPHEVLKLQNDLPQPTATDLKPNEVLVRVSHVSLFAPTMNLMAAIPHFNSKPHIPELSFAGMITAVAMGTSTPLSAGDEVFGMINPKKGGYNGVLAEYIVVPVDLVVRQPENISVREASGLGGGGCTVIDFAEQTGLIEIVETGTGPSLVNKADGKRILITGGNTGTGQFMVQLARSLVGKSGVVVATASPRSKKHVLELGARKVIDYTSISSLHEHLIQGYSDPSTVFDTIIDIAGTDPQLYPKSPAYLREDGWFIFGGNMSKTHAKPSTSALSAFFWIFTLIISVLGWVLHMFRPVILGGVPRKCRFISGTPSQRNLRLVQQLVEEGELRSIVDSEWRMEDVLKAYEHLAQGRLSGKVVVNVQS